MSGAPTRSAFRSYAEYAKGLTRYLNSFGYDPPRFFPSQDMVSYEVNQAMRRALRKCVERNGFVEKAKAFIDGDRDPEFDLGGIPAS